MTHVAVAQRSEPAGDEPGRDAGSTPASNASNILKLTLPWPPSVNTYWRSIVRHGASHASVLISERGRQYREYVGQLCTDFRVKQWAHVHEGKPLVVLIECWPPDRRARDLDNIPKSILDSLVHARVMRDDADIWSLCVTRKALSSPPGRVEVYLSEFDWNSIR